MITLRRWELIALAAVALGVGVALGALIRPKAPAVSASADAGVALTLDAGVEAQSNCAATVEHWQTIYVQGPIRYVPMDGGIQQQPQTIAILVPDVRLTGSSGVVANVEEQVSAQAGSSALTAPGAPERHWEVGPAVLYGVGHQSVLWGAQGGWNGGPFDIRGQAMKGPGDVYVGVSVGWRF